MGRISTRGSSVPIVGALGVVFGDIGTSPLYALKEVFHPSHGIELVEENVLGVLSLVFWTLLVVVSLKYAFFVMRVENRGEGGIMALAALVDRTAAATPRRRRLLLAVGVFGAALFYGDSVITPAISVLSAVEGLESLEPELEPYVVPIALVILLLLFLVQRAGSAGVGAFFGPVMLLWFLVLAALGIKEIVAEPGVVRGLDPSRALRFLLQDPLAGLLSLGSIVLVVTGCEALYADMGHFGGRAIRRAWGVIVLPALALDYFGQGAVLIRRPEAIDNPFYAMAPAGTLLLLVGLATLATVIASQAVISGAFSMSRQATLLGYLPRLRVVQTSSSRIGQIYVPFVNAALGLGVAALVLVMQNSSNLAAAYGLAVTGTMACTTLLALVVRLSTGGRLRWALAAVGVLFLGVDLAFLGGTLPKIPHGGWFSLLLAAALFLLLVTWKRGRELLRAKQADQTLPLASFLRDLERRPPRRVPGTAVFLTPHGSVPRALLHNLVHNKVMHERVIVLTVRTEGIPHVAEADRVELAELGHGLWRMILRYGFKDEPDVPRALGRCDRFDPPVAIVQTSFFFSRETILPARRPGMARWRIRLFAWMTRSAASALEYLGIPPNRVLELGAQIEI